MTHYKFTFTEWFSPGAETADSHWWGLPILVPSSRRSAGAGNVLMTLNSAKVRK